MEPVESASSRAPRITQHLAYHPLPHADEASHSAHQQRQIDTLGHTTWPYGPTHPAPEGWQNREDFTYPDLPQPQKPDVVESRKEGQVYRNHFRIWERNQGLRAIDAQRA
jgi:hypothetical protein